MGVAISNDEFISGSRGAQNNYPRAPIPRFIGASREHLNTELYRRTGELFILGQQR